MTLIRRLAWRLGQELARRPRLRDTPSPGSRCRTWMLGAVGFVDTGQAIVNPDQWVTRLLFWPHLGAVVSVVGLSLVAFLAVRPYSDRSVASELNNHAGWAIPHLRDRQIHNATEEAELQRDYGRWHQRVEDLLRPFEHRFPTEYSSFTTLGEHVEVDALEGVTLEHARLKGMIELKVTRLRELSQAIQGAGWLD